MARSRKPSRRILCRAPASLLLFAVLGLAACGEDAPESGTTPQDVKRDVTAALSDRDSVCDADSYATDRFVNRSSYGVPEYASRVEKTCEEDVRAFAARSVKVSGVRVSGDRAKATVVATGGAYAFGNLTFAFVRDGVWKIDRITALDVDRAKFNASQRRIAEGGDEPLTPAQIGCALRRLSRLDDRELERALIRSDPKLATDPALVCILRPELRRQGLSAAEASCIIRTLRSTDGFIAILLREDQKEIEELLAQAIPACAESSI